MELFNMLFVLSIASDFDDDKLDIIRKLPIEIAIIILRMLNGETLLKVKLVSKTWYNICQSDKEIRKKIRMYKKQMKLKMREIIFGPVGNLYNYVPRNENTAFRKRNMQINCDVKPVNRTRTIPINVKYEVPLLVLQSNCGNSLPQQNKQKCTNKPVRGINLTQKKRLRRL